MALTVHGDGKTVFLHNFNFLLLSIKPMLWKCKVDVA